MQKRKESKEKWIKSRNLIIQILKEYELGDAYLILQGLELVGYDYQDFWFQVVETVKKYKGIESLVAYVDVMQQIGRERLFFYMNEINNKHSNFQSCYVAFLNLLQETRKYSDEVMNVNLK